MQNKKPKRIVPNVDQKRTIDDFKANRIGKRIRIDTITTDSQKRFKAMKKKEARVVGTSPLDPEIYPDLIAVHVEATDGKTYTVFHNVNHIEQHYEELD